MYVLYIHITYTIYTSNNYLIKNIQWINYNFKRDQCTVYPLCMTYQFLNSTLSLGAMCKVDKLSFTNRY